MKISSKEYETKWQHINWRILKSERHAFKIDNHNTLCGIDSYDSISAEYGHAVQYEVCENCYEILVLGASKINRKTKRYKPKDENAKVINQGYARKILLQLYDKEALTYTQLLELFQTHSSLSYYLKNLKKKEFKLIENLEGKYYLTNKGLIVLEIIKLINNLTGADLTNEETTAFLSKIKEPSRLIKIPSYYDEFKDVIKKAIQEYNNENK